MPTPAGVPVAMMSPGISVSPAEIVAMMRRDVEDQQRDVGVLPQLAVDEQRMPVSAMSISSAVTAHGPIGQKVSCDLPISHWL